MENSLQVFFTPFRPLLCTVLTSHGSALAPGVSDDDGLLVLPLPGHRGLGVAAGLAGEGDAGALHGDGVVAGLVVEDVGGLHHLQHPDLADHGLRVDLAHVVAAVVALHVLDVQLPGVVAVVGDGHAGVVGHHVVVDRQDRLAVRPQPRHLHKSFITRVS